MLLFISDHNPSSSESSFLFPFILQYLHISVDINRDALRYTQCHDQNGFGNKERLLHFTGMGMGKGNHDIYHDHHSPAPGLFLPFLLCHFLTRTFYSFYHHHFLSVLRPDDNTLRIRSWHRYYYMYPYIPHCEAVRSSRLLQN